MRILMLMVFLGGFSFIPFGSSESQQGKCARAEHSEWLVAALRQIKTVKPSMTRAQLLNLFEPDTGFHTLPQRTYVYRECPYIKLDVTFSPSEDHGSAGGGNDVISDVSKPYLEERVYD